MEDGKNEQKSIKQQVAGAADKNGMCEMVAMKAIRDNGKNYAPGDELHMHSTLAVPHIEAGACELKQTASKSHKQVTGSQNK